MLLAYSSDEIKIEEETLMIGTSSYIGSVGGSLGLFLGFSCFTYLSCCIQKVFELCDKFKQWNSFVIKWSISLEKSINVFLEYDK